MADGSPAAVTQLAAPSASIGLDKEATRAHIARAFHETSIQFAEASVSAWPDDAYLPLALASLKSTKDAEALLDATAKAFGSKVDALARKDPQALFAVGRHEQLAILGIEAKYAGANGATQDTIWAYVGSLCKFVSMYGLYAKIPSAILGVVNGAAMDLKAAIDSGAMDMNSINPMELGQKVMAQIDPREIESFMTSLMSDQDAMMSMMTQMSSIVGGPSAIMGQAGGMEAFQAALQNAGGSGGLNMDIGSLLKGFKK
jgi:hypothetical protein